MHGPKDNISDELRGSLRRITLGGCLAMVFVTCVMAPQATEFFRTLGANELQFGLLGGVPLIMLAFQFLGAFAANRVERRKPFFMLLLISSRLLYMPAVFLPLAVGAGRIDLAMSLVILFSALSGAMTNFATPLWFSWMADVIPRETLSRYWGTRQLWMQAVAVTAYLAVAGFTSLVVRDVTVAYPLIAVVGCVAGVIDISLFRRVAEPANPVLRGKPFLGELLEPLKHAEFRSFIAYSCFWNFAAMVGSTFMLLYVLKELRVDLWKTILVWACPGIGLAVSSPVWGRVADRHGHRPIIVLCTIFKPLIALVFILITPATAVAVLAPALFLDSMLNAGIAIATNGFMLRLSPRENRSMFVASVTGLAGICGGVAATLSGVYLHAMSGFSCEVLGRTWNNYHLIFTISFLLRFIGIVMARNIRETRSSHTREILDEFRDTWVGRVLMLMPPINLYGGTQREDEP